ncbi:hypothetical protein [Mycolicibacterium vinylchloridicum]|uniref:hypothetical protein n=1 Tax=Mycolicibacterium vinylchloridicum TaxID=2736928 RepID=UPI0015C87941|nr:hypothetical protein [Mycolicibacterium vinylchloridicum]
MTENKNVLWFSGLAVAAGLGVAVGGAAAASADTGTAGPANTSKADNAQSAGTGHTNRVKAGPAKSAANKPKPKRVTVTPLAAASLPASVRAAAAPAPAAAVRTAAASTPNAAALSAPVTADVSAISRATAAANPIQQLLNGVANLIKQILAIPQAIINQITKLFRGPGSSQGSGDYKVTGSIPLSAGHGVTSPPMTVGPDGRIYALSLTYSAGGTTTGAELQIYPSDGAGTYSTVALDPAQFTYGENSTGTYNIVAGVGSDTNVYLTGFSGTDRPVIMVSATGVVKTIPLGATSDVSLVATSAGVFASSSTLDDGTYKPALWTINPATATATKAILGSFILSTALAYRDGPALAGGPNGVVFLVGSLTNSTQGVATVGAGGVVGTPVAISNGTSTFYLNGTRFVADAGHVYTPRYVINATTGAVSSIPLALGNNGRATFNAVGSDGLVYINSYDSLPEGTANGAVKVYNPATNKVVATVKLGDYVYTVAEAGGKIYALRRDDSTGKYYVDIISKNT